MKPKKMKKIDLILLFQLLFFATVSAANIDVKISSGIEAAYNFDFNKATNVFKKIAQDYPKRPEGYHYISMIYLWSYLGSKSSYDYSSFLRYSDLALDLAEKRLEESEDSPSNNYMMGQIYTFRAMAFAKKQSSLEAFWATKKAVDYLESTVRLNPKFYDACYGLGLFKYTLSFVPSLFNWALKVTGLSADRREGLNLLKKSFKYGKMTKVESAYHLSRIYTDYIADYDSAQSYLSYITEKYPRNIIFTYQNALLKINQRRMDQAEFYINKILAQKDSRMIQTSSYTFFLKAEVEFRKNNFENALTFYDKFLTTSTDFDYSGITYFNIAICNYALQNEEIAKKNLLLARNGNDDISDDNYAKRRSSILFEKGMSKKMLTIFLAKNDLLAGNYSKVIAKLKPLIDSLDIPDEKGEALLILSDALISSNRIKEALQFSISGGKIDYQNEKWIYPNILFISAKAHKAAGKWKDARQIVSEAERNNDGDFKDKLMPQINFLKKQLKMSI